MSKFVSVNFPSTHLGVERIENAASFLKSRHFRLGSARTLAAMLLAAMVAALLVVANQVIDTITDGHLFAAWIGLWAIGFAGMALLAEPAIALAASLRRRRAAARQAREEKVQDETYWQSALDDERVMADLRGAMGRVGG